MSVTTADHPSPSVQCREFLLEGIAPGMAVLDIGCGDGDLMTQLAGRGCSVSGIEIDPNLVRSCRGAGLDVNEGQAEALPIDDASIDAIVCSVVIPYTDEKQAVAEWARVLKPGGFVQATYHGPGYAVAYMFRGHHWRLRIYGLRMLGNTVSYRILGRRLPGFLGDTLCQTSRRMQSYYRASGLVLESEQLIDRIAALPRFIAHRVVKPR